MFYDRKSQRGQVLHGSVGLYVEQTYTVDRIQGNIQGYLEIENKRIGGNF